MYILIVSWSENILRHKTVRFLCNLVLRKTLQLCGDLGPINTSKLSIFDEVLDPSQKCLEFLLEVRVVFGSARSIQNNV